MKRIFFLSFFVGTQLCFGMTLESYEVGRNCQVPIDVFHCHVPLLWTMAAHVAHEKELDPKESLLQVMGRKARNLVGHGEPVEKNIQLCERLWCYFSRLHGGENLSAENLSEASYAIQYKKADPRKLYIDLCKKNTDDSHNAATSLLLHGACNYMDARTPAVERVRQAETNRVIAADWAVRTGNEGSLLVLINGFDTQMPAEGGRSNAEVLTDLLKCKDAVVLHMAALFGLEKGVACLLERASRYLRVDEFLAFISAEDNAAVRHAAARGFNGITKMLLEYGADIHVHDDKVLRMTVERGDAAMVGVLLKMGANPYAADDAALKFAKRELKNISMECEDKRGYIALLKKEDRTDAMEYKKMWAEVDALSGKEQGLQEIVLLLRDNSAQNQH